MGLEVDPEAEREARVLYDEGMKLMEAGQLRFAAERFRAATEKVALKTRVGGEATLQRAIALDSMGYNDEAKAMYKTSECCPCSWNGCFSIVACLLPIIE